MVTKTIEVFVLYETFKKLKESKSDNAYGVGRIFLPKDVSPEHLDNYRAVKITIELPERKIINMTESEFRSRMIDKSGNKRFLTTDQFIEEFFLEE